MTARASAADERDERQATTEAFEAYLREMMREFLAAHEGDPTRRTLDEWAVLCWAYIDARNEREEIQV